MARNWRWGGGGVENEMKGVEGIKRGSRVEEEWMRR